MITQGQEPGTLGERLAGSTGLVRGEVGSRSSCLSQPPSARDPSVPGTAQIAWEPAWPSAARRSYTSQDLFLDLPPQALGVQGLHAAAVGATSLQSNQSHSLLHPTPASWAQGWGEASCHRVGIRPAEKQSLLTPTWCPVRSPHMVRGLA